MSWRPWQISGMPHNNPHHLLHYTHPTPPSTTLPPPPGLWEKAPVQRGWLSLKISPSIIWATNQLFRLSILRPGDKFNQQTAPGLRDPCFVAKIAKWICALKCPWAGPYLIFDIVGRGALVTLNMCWVTIGDSANLGTVQQILRKSSFYCKLFRCNKKNEKKCQETYG